jgi:hypothetical protein
MNGLSDSLTIGILLLLVFGAVSFYLYSRISQAERRVTLLENLLMDLKMSTEAAFTGVDLQGVPDFVRPVSSPSPLEKEDVDDVKEDEYAAMLASTNPMQFDAPAPGSEVSELPPIEEEQKEEEEVKKASPVDVNYESMTLKELQALARERGIAVSSQRKRELIDALKKVVKTEVVEPFVGASTGKEGYSVQLEL